MEHDTGRIEPGIDKRQAIALAWVALVLLYAYCDILSLFRPGTLSEMLAGRMGPVAASQGSILAAAALMAIPIAMIAVTAILPRRPARLVSLISAAVYFAVNVGNLVGESWAYYYAFGMLELAATAFIFAMSLKWKG